MEIPSWAGKVATVAGLASPVTAPIVIGKWVADKAVGALGPKTEAAPVQTQPQAPAVKPEPQVVNEEGQVKPAYVQADTKNNGAQKLVGNDGKWNGTAILNGQTQFSQTDKSAAVEQEHRCGPAAVLASQVMKGPEATGKMVGSLSTRYPEGSPERQELDGIQKRIGEGTATHEDLSRVQHQMYQQYHPKGQEPGLTPAQVTQMEKDLTGVKMDSKFADFDNGSSFRTTTNDGVAESPDRMQGRLQNLKPGQSFVQFVDTDGDNKANHFVLMGKDADGQAYAYDPGSKTNQPQMVFQNERPQAYSHYAGGAMGVNESDGSRGQLVAGGTL